MYLTHKIDDSDMQGSFDRRENWQYLQKSWYGPLFTDCASLNI